MFCIWIYGLPVVAGMLGEGVEAAVPAVGLCFSGYALLATVLGFAQPWLFARMPGGVAHGLALLVGAAGMLVLGTATRAVWLAPAFVALAVCWSTIGAVPYAAAAAAAPPGRGAATLRLFGFSTVLPQIATTFGLATLAGRWGLQSASVMLVGAAELALAGLLTLWWRDWIVVPGQDW
jgi:hypothetical protein